MVDVPFLDLNCTNGKVYDPCAPACQPSCGDMTGMCGGEDDCVETCRCPDGLVQEGERCVRPEDCGCTLSFNGLYLEVRSLNVWIVF